MPIIRDAFGRFASAAPRIEPIVIQRPVLAVDDEKFVDRIRKNWGLLHAPTVDDQALIDKMVKFAKQRKGGMHDCANWGGIKANGETVADGNTACHAGMQRVGNKNYKFVYSNFCWNYNGGNMGHLTQEMKERFINWLVNTSPYAAAFVKKDVKEILDDGCVVATTNMPANILAGGFISARRLTEYGEVVQNWDGLAQRGVNPDAAFIHAHGFGVHGKSAVLTRTNSGHCSQSGSDYTKDHVINFMAHKPVTELPFFNKDSSQYAPVSHAWARGERGGYLRDEFGRLGDAAKKGGKLPDAPKKNVNPFINREAPPDGVPYEPFLDLYAERLIQEYGKAA